MIRRVVCLLRGGLGNQLFQICNIAILSRSLEANFYISDLNTFHLQRGLGGTESLSLPISELFPEHASLHVLNSKSRLFVKFLMATSNRLDVPKVLNESHDYFSKLPRLSLLEGYFQDKTIVNQIPIASLNRVFPRAHVKSNINKVADRVCLHIRRRDYPKSISQQFGSEYYRKAVKKFQNLGFTKFDCYSDDLSAAQEILSFLPESQKHFPETQVTLDSISLLQEMAMYKNFILSQSSLVWWASYIAFRNDSKVRIEGKLSSLLDFRNSHVL